MHSQERAKWILEALEQRGFISLQELERQLTESAATIRRDLRQLDEAGLVTRVRGGVKRAGHLPVSTGRSTLSGVPFHENIHRNRFQKELIGRAAAKLCNPSEGVMIDGGSTTLQMCPHLAGLNLQVLTNSLHIVNALLTQAGTQILVPSGQVFPEQNIILSAAGEDGMPRFHAPRLFLGAASVGQAGLMQADFILVAGERLFIDRADQIIVMVDSSKFEGPSGHVVCPLEEIDTVITDSAISPRHMLMLEKARVEILIAR